MDICHLTIEQSLEFFENLTLDDFQYKVAGDLVREILSRLKFLKEVGLGYLSLDRESGTLSGGEAQRIRLATQIGGGLVGVLYILDEPSIGLHQRDNDRLLETLIRLRDLGNSPLFIMRYKVDLLTPNAATTSLERSIVSVMVSALLVLFLNRYKPLRLKQS